jgi:hypothetical protein
MSHAATKTVTLPHPFGGKAPMTVQVAPTGFVMAAEFSLRSAQLLLCARGQADCESAGGELLGHVGYAPLETTQGRTEAEPRYWPVPRELLEQAVALLIEHGGAVDHALARHFEKCLKAQPT